jgi:hypothetical protein
MSEKRRRKRHSPEQIVRKLRDAEAMLNSGGRVADPGGERSDVRSLARPVRRHEGRRGRAIGEAGGGG